MFQVPEKEREERKEQLFQFSRLKPFQKRQAGKLSGGMKQKLALSCALIHTPEILVLDEPTFGVDPVSRQEFWEILRIIQKEGVTILVSTAYMDEADQCDRIALFFDGNIKGVGTPDELRAKYDYPLYKLTGSDLHKLRESFSSFDEVHTTQLFGDSVHVSFQKEPIDKQWKVWQESTDNNLMEWTKLKPTIEDVFLDLMGTK